MIKKMVITLSLCSISFSQKTSSSIKELPADLQQQLLIKNISDKELSNQEISRLLQKNRRSFNSQTLTRDTSISSDTIKESNEILPSDTMTVYEKMIRGDTINPDSMLKNLTIFGHDIFSRANPSTFASTENISIPLNYVINIGDEIIILLWGRINEEYRLQVDRNGFVNIPKLGPVPVAGKQFSVMKDDLKLRIEQMEGVNASISIGSMRTIGIYIVGEVRAPGFYTVSALSNITNALFAAGGPSKNGSLRNIQLKRNKKLITSVDLYDFLLEGNDQSGLRLQSGDVIHIPIIQKMVAIVGNVRRCALYELKGNETLGEVLTLSGGITPSAWKNTIQIERFIENNRQVVVDIDSINEKTTSIPVYDGDIIKIFPILDKNQNAVFISGNFSRPGKYEFKNGMRLTDIIPEYRTLLPETYLEYAIVIRQDPPRYLNRIQTFNLKNALDKPLSTDNISLQKRDHIIIYNLDYFEPDRTVEIDGSVTNTGKYKLLTNMKIRDLILQAGGLRDDASITRGELYRRILDSKTDLISTTKIDFCVVCALKDDVQHNLSLQRLDRVFIRSKLGWEEERKITLRGQINYPGTYVLYEGETLGDLIERAGGYKEDAYLSAAVFTRISVKELEQKRIKDYSRQLETDILNLSAEIASKENPAEAQAMLEQQIALKNSLVDSKATGRVVIDLTDRKNTIDFTLEDGDDLFIPRNLNTVSVLGEVYNPSTFKYEKSSSNVSHYLEAAGGAKSTADIKHIYIIKANGNIITNKNTKVMKTALAPGDAVMVPQKIKYSNPHKLFVDTVDAIFKISTLLGTVITLIILVNSLKNP